jgi:Spy/CpxP family protein refolding chaperone
VSFPSGSPRAYAVALLAVAFLAGILGGIVFDRWVLLPPRLHALRSAVERFPGGPGEGFPGRRARMERHLLEELDLTAEQEARAESLLARQHERSRAIMDRARPELRAIADSTHAALRAILTPEQMERLEQLEKERRGGRTRRGGRRGGPPGPR